LKNFEKIGFKILCGSVFNKYDQLCTSSPQRLEHQSQSPLESFIIPTFNFDLGLNVPYLPQGVLRFHEVLIIKPTSKSSSMTHYLLLTWIWLTIPHNQQLRLSVLVREPKLRNRIQVQLVKKP
jgi:hypothetical protein